MKHAVHILMETTCAAHIEMEYVAKINNVVPKVKYSLLKKNQDIHVIKLIKVALKLKKRKWNMKDNKNYECDLFLFNLKYIYIYH